jgi:hypothetical protein
MHVFPDDLDLNFPFPVDWFVNKDVLIINVGHPHIRSIDIVVNAVIKHPSIKSVFIYSPDEVAEYDFLDAVDNILPKVFNIQNIVMCDSGVPVYRPNILHIPLSWFSHWRRRNGLVDTTQNRLYKFCCFNAIARSHRVRLVVEIIRNNLLEHGQVSCGWHHINAAFDFAKFVPPELMHYFPMSLDSVDSTEQLNYYNTVVITAPLEMTNSVFNVISETSMDQYTYQDLCWSRGMITEKTIKAYAYCQFPIWLAVKGFVQYQRELGFDVFDDIIDHSYDNVKNPSDRIKLIINELKKIAELPMETLNELLQVNWSRLQQNQNHIQQVSDHITQTSGDALMGWLDVLVQNKEMPHPRLKGLKIKV